MKTHGFNVRLIFFLLSIFTLWSIFMWFAFCHAATTVEQRIVVPSSSEPVIIQETIWNNNNPSTGG
jgi:hypothetical protein